MNIGFDIDGTLTIQKFEDIHKTLNKSDRIENFLSKMIDFTPSFYLDLLKAHQKINDSISLITFRRQSWQHITNQWLTNNNVDPNTLHCHFAPTDLETNDPEVYKINVVKYKADIINKNNIHIYYDDTDFLVDLLKILCPKTLIVKAIV
jgi:hypothetical protein